MRALGSSLSQLPLSFLSRQTLTFCKAPSITVVETEVVAGAGAGGGDGAGEALSLPPPQPAMEAIRTREPSDTERRMNGVVVGACDMAVFG